MDTILNLLRELHPEADPCSDALVDDGILSSLDVVTLILQLNEAFDISIPVEEILPDNFNSAEAILAMVERIAQ